MTKIWMIPGWVCPISGTTFSALSTRLGRGRRCGTRSSLLLTRTATSEPANGKVETEKLVALGSGLAQ